MRPAVCASRSTGKERDSESGNDYAVARYFSSQYGRFLTLDPAGLGAVDPANPQSWNRYAYVMNNPLAATDPTGLCDFAGEDTGDSCGGCSFWDACFGFPINPCDFIDCGRGGGWPTPVPQAPPAPPGGYGAGIDPFGGNAFLGGLIDIGLTQTRVGNRGGPWGPWGCHVYVDGVDLGTVGDAFPTLGGSVAIALAIPDGSIVLSNPGRYVPSCAGVFGEGFSNGLDAVSPSSYLGGGPTPVGGSPEEIALAGARANAAQYIVNRGLVVALRSSIYRGLNFVGDVTEAVPLAQGGYAAAAGDLALAKAKFVTHSCQMP
jgi:RHS repeat-associated protein